MDAKFSDLQKTLQTRADVYRFVREFFDKHGFMEVQTPVRIPAPALEQNIDPEPSGEWYLRTSPEFHMKRLLCSGCEKIYQIGPCFRQDERGRLHNPEFTMIEWYETNSGYIDMLAYTKALMAFVSEKILGSTSIDAPCGKVELMPYWELLRVRDAFLLNAGWDPVSDSDEDRFDFDMVTKVEPALPVDKPVVLIDYPLELSAMAKTNPKDQRIAERWELYIGGVELANACSELTDPLEQRRRFERWRLKRLELGKPPFPLDEKFLAAMENKMPPCAGVALGLDRLIMLLTGSNSIEPHPGL